MVIYLLLTFRSEYRQAILKLLEQESILDSSGHSQIDWGRVGLDEEVSKARHEGTSTTHRAADAQMA